MSLNAMLQEREPESDLVIHPTTSWGETRLQRVVVTDVRIPFGSVVALLLKWTLAAIPAALVLGGLLAGAFYLVTQVLGVRASL